MPREHHEGVPGSSLLGLQHKIDASVRHGSAHPLRLVADDGIYIVRGDDTQRRLNYVLQKRLATYFM